jgi:hypothetical protein
MGDRGLAAALYIDDVRASISARWVLGAGSPIDMRCAFVGHLRNAENIAAVIGLLAFIATDHAKVLTGTICKKGRSNTASAGDREHSDGPSWVEGSVDMAVGMGPLRSALRPAPIPISTCLLQTEGERNVRRFRRPLGMSALALIATELAHRYLSYGGRYDP